MESGPALAGSPPLQAQNGSQPLNNCGEPTKVGPLSDLPQINIATLFYFVS